MVEALRESPILLLFLVAAIGYALGQVRIGSLNLGVAAVLFVGLGFGAWAPGAELPAIVYELGLVLFVYSMGLSSGPGFLSSLRRRGLPQNLLTIGVLVAAAAITRWLGPSLQLGPPATAGLFAGSLTNTPALAAVLDALRHQSNPATLDALLAAPVVGYSLCYPGAVLIPILALQLARRRLAQTTRSQACESGDLHNVTIEVAPDADLSETLAEMRARHGWQVVFGRIKRDDQLKLATPDLRLLPGDQLSIIGAPTDLEPVVTALGRRIDAHLEFDRSRLDFRRMFVSNRDAIGRPLRDLQLPQRFGAIITRIRRGDVDLLAKEDSVLELGDRIRIVAPPDRMDPIRRYFGDSYRQLSEVDGVSLGLGIALGLLLGLMPVPLPGGATLKLGLAGGPLLVGLTLGAVGRTGSIVWSLPYSANLTLRQLGLLLFLAGVGLRSGHAFATTLAQGGWLPMLLGGALISTLTAGLTLWIGQRWLKLPFGILAGVLAGVTTQPAVLAFASERTGDDQPLIGYAAVYPAAMIGKILLAQAILLL